VPGQGPRISPGPGAMNLCASSPGAGTASLPISFQQSVLCKSEEVPGGRGDDVPFPRLGSQFFAPL
jgi:hypothetical protein